MHVLSSLANIDRLKTMHDLILSSIIPDKFFHGDSNAAELWLWFTSIALRVDLENLSSHNSLDVTTPQVHQITQKSSTILDPPTINMNSFTVIILLILSQVANAEFGLDTRDMKRQWVLSIVIVV